MRLKHYVTLLAIAGIASSSKASSISNGDLALLQVGDGTTLSSSGNAFSILDLSNSGTVKQTIGITSTGANGLQISGSATSEGQLSLSGDGKLLSFGGYNPGSGGFTGSGSLAGRTSTQAPRAYGSVSISTGSYSFGSAYSGTSKSYTGNNIRGVASNGSGDFYGAGGTHGTIDNNGGTTTIIQNTNANTQAINVINGNLYYSTSSGIFGFTGVPTASATPQTIISGLSGEGTKSSDFTFSPDGNTLYVADSTLGIQKFVKSGGTFAFAYNITTANLATLGVTGLAVDFSGANPVVYATDPNNLYKYADTGAGQATSILQSSTNYAFRGLELVPEPSSLAALGLGGLTLLRRRRR